MRFLRVGGRAGARQGAWRGFGHGESGDRTSHRHVLLWRWGHPGIGGGSGTHGLRCGDRRDGSLDRGYDMRLLRGPRAGRAGGCARRRRSESQPGDREGQRGAFDRGRVAGGLEGRRGPDRLSRDRREGSISPGGGGGVRGRAQDGPRPLQNAGGMGLYCADHPLDVRRDVLWNCLADGHRLQPGHDPAFAAGALLGGSQDV